MKGRSAGAGDTGAALLARLPRYIRWLLVAHWGLRNPPGFCWVNRAHRRRAPGAAGQPRSAPPAAAPRAAAGCMVRLCSSWGPPAGAGAGAAGAARRVPGWRKLAGGLHLWIGGAVDVNLRSERQGEAEESGVKWSVGRCACAKRQANHVLRMPRGGVQAVLQRGKAAPAGWEQPARRSAPCPPRCRGGDRRPPALASWRLRGVWAQAGRWA